MFALTLRSTELKEVSNFKSEYPGKLCLKPAKLPMLNSPLRPKTGSNCLETLKYAPKRCSLKSSLELGKTSFCLTSPKKIREDAPVPTVHVLYCFLLIFS